MEKPNSPYKIKKIQVIYELMDGGIDSSLDKEIERHFVKNYSMKFQGSGYNLTTKQRDISFNSF